MIIIEGPDNAGKSTLAAYLSTVFKLPIHHPGGPPASKEETEERCKFALDNHDKFIFDRTPFISEPVYCVLRSEDSYIAEAKELYARFESLQPVVIYCRPPDNYVLNMKSHGVKDYDSPSHIAALMSKQKVLLTIYDNLMKALPNIRYDYTSDGIYTLTERVKHELVRMDNYKNKKSSEGDSATHAISH